MQRPTIVGGTSVTSAAWRARVRSARAGPRPKRERVQRRASALHAQAISRSKGQGWNVGSRAGAEGTAASRLCSASFTVHGANVACAARRARESEPHVLGLVPRESERSGAQAHYTRKPPRAVEGRAGTWEHGLAPKERRLLTRAVPFHGARSKCRQRGAARARRKRPCWASSPERASAVARKRAKRASYHAQ